MVSAFRGRDTVFGGIGNDQIWAGPGADVVWANSGDDVAWGATGSDVLRGRGGNDRLNGSFGNDWLYGGFGADELYGGYGRDRLHAVAKDGEIDKLFCGPDRDVAVVREGETVEVHGCERVVTVPDTASTEEPGEAPAND